MQMAADGCGWCVWVHWCTIETKRGKVGTGGRRHAWFVVPGGREISRHHVRTHFAKKSAKRETSTQNMNQPPHKLCIQPNKSNQEPTIPKNSSKREKYTDSKKMCWKSDPFSELKNCFAKFIHVSTLRYRYGLCLRCIGAACPHNMGSQLLILTEFGPKQYQNAKRVHSAKVNGFRWLFENFRVTSKLRVNCE